MEKAVVWTIGLLATEVAVLVRNVQHYVCSLRRANLQSSLGRFFMTKHSEKRFWTAIAVCSVLGIVFGCATGQAAVNECAASAFPSDACLLKDPWQTRLENISFGLFAGMGGAVGATWQSWKKNNE
jgi:TctA family transporter